MTDLELIEVIRAAAFEVRMHLGPGYLEAVYRNALLIEMRSRGLTAQEEYPLEVSYKSQPVGVYRADILVGRRIIPELKSVRELAAAHETQLVNYLSVTGLNYGVLINYGGEKFAFRVKTRIYNRP